MRPELGGHLLIVARAVPEAVRNAELGGKAKRARKVVTSAHLVKEHLRRY